jgi:beta-glucosidase-like glycosyl hydrolase
VTDVEAAASWDRDAMYRRAKAIGEEARGKGINTQFGPGVNLMRTPQAGRAFECKPDYSLKDKDTEGSRQRS